MPMEKILISRQFFCWRTRPIVFSLAGLCRRYKSRYPVESYSRDCRNQEASISITQEVPIESVTLISNSATTVTQSSIEFRSVGVKLDILPRISSDNFVHLKIDQEISSVGPTCDRRFDYTLIQFPVSEYPGGARRQPGFELGWTCWRLALIHLCLCRRSG